MTQSITAVTIDEGTVAQAQAEAIQEAVAGQFVGEDGAGGLTEQLGTLTTSIAGITIEDGEDEGTIEDTQAGQIQAAVEAVQGTMTAIGELKEAEGLSDTVVDAIGILENAWAELGEVQLGTATVGGIDAEEAEDITGVTQAQVDKLEIK